MQAADVGVGDRGRDGMPEALTSVKLAELIELPSTVSLKLTVTGVSISTLVPLKAGLVFITVGVVTEAAVVVNDHENGADIATPELLRRR